MEPIGAVHATDMPEAVVLDESKTEKQKEERAYRVGLSYRCKHCGLPKKGHVCTGKPAADTAKVVAASEPAKKKVKVVKAAADNEEDEAEGDNVWADPSAVLSVIKAVLPKVGEGKGTTVSKRKRKKDESSAPPPMLGQTEAEKAVLELDVIRPPSLITPADGEMLHGLSSSMSTRSGLRSAGRQGGGVPGGPPSLLSSFFGTEGSVGSIFSPSALMNGLVESPAPALSSSPSLSTPGVLSPASFFNALAFPPNGLPSAGLPSTSGRA